MAKLTFNGGIHPYDGKDLTRDFPIVDILPKKELVFPLSQHIGAPADPIVKKGDKVLRGQKIAEASGYVSAPIHSSVSGIVKAIEPRKVVTGDMVMSIVVENDEQYEEVPYDVCVDADALTGEEIVQKVKEAGVVGMGGAGFPTYIKLSPKNPKNIDYVIANCAECEPYLTSDYRRMLEEPEKLVEGMKIMLRLFENAQGILAVEDNKPECIEILKKLTKDERKITVKELKTKYPQGSERQLIYAACGRRLSSEKLPADVGCIVDNVDTIVAVYHAVMDGKPLMERIVTVTGDCIRNPRNYKVHIGMKYQDLLEASSNFIKKPAKIISGGPMMGFALYGLEVPTTKTASALLCLSRDDVSKEKETACINCGRCSQVCPSRLLPNKLADYANRGREEEFLKYYGMECIECGCCSYVCPAKRHLTHSIKSMRKMQLEKKKK